MLEKIQAYFPNLTDRQKQQFELLAQRFPEWNAQINLVSRKDIEQLEIHHLLHSLAIAKVIDFQAGTQVMDLGTGGGFPGLPLSILFPEVEFRLVDSIQKKIKVVFALAEELELENVTAQVARAENVDHQFDFVVSRAVAPLTDLVTWVKPSIVKHFSHKLKNGIICLKGGDLTEEIRTTNRKVTTWPITDFFQEPWYEGKFVVHVPLA